MQALWDAAFSGPNMVYTILLMVVLLYWLLVLIGTLDFGSLDIELDLDADVDAEIDAEVGGLEGMAGILHFFNLGRVPFMVILSFAALAMWASSILANYYLSDGSVWFPILFFLPIVFVGLITAKLLTTPLIPIFKSLNTAAEAVERTRLCAISQEALKQSIEKDSSLAFSMLGSLSWQLHNLVDDLERLKTRNTAQRLGIFLLQRYGDNEKPGTLRLPYEKSLLAARLGMTPESLSRSFSNLATAGVRCEGNLVTIENPARLAEHCQFQST